uniref:Transcription factor HNF-4 homolog n=1 Tax=Parastrongyloides trichosuri TaxID=131310 RepID=A0A0N4Z0F2_PARTI
MSCNTDSFTVEELLKAKSVEDNIQNSTLERDDIYRKIEYCKICGDLADSYHYSVSSCRGCNAFFRRAINLNMSFVCRHGGNCVIDKNTRCACRACRFEKCIQSGMDPNAVQPKRDNYTRIDNYKNNVENEIILSYNESKSPGFDNNKKLDKVQHSPVSVISSVSTQINFEESPKSVSPICQELTYLYDLIIKYPDDCIRRRTLCCDTVEEMLLPNDFLPQPCFINDIVTTYRVEMPLMFQWLTNIPGFSNIPNPMDKAKLLKEFSTKYYLLNIITNTIDLDIDDKIMLVNNRYILPQICPIIDSQNMFNNQLINILYGKTCIDMIEELVKPMKEMNIETIEIIALRIIMFWNPGNVGLSKEINKWCQLYSESFIKDLDKWYEIKGREGNDITSRVSRVILLIPGITKLAYTLKGILETLGHEHLISFGDDSLKKILSV